MSEGQRPGSLNSNDPAGVTPAVAAASQADERGEEMDPDATLAELMALVAYQPCEPDVETLAEANGRIEELVRALDLWLIGGGYLPTRWATTGSDLQPNRSMSIPQELDCIQDYDGGLECDGPVEYRMALSGSGRSFPRCGKHWSERLNLEEELHRLSAPDA